MATSAYFDQGITGEAFMSEGQFCGGDWVPALIFNWILCKSIQVDTQNGCVYANGIRAQGGMKVEGRHQ